LRLEGRGGAGAKEEPLEGGKLKKPVKMGFTAESGRTKSDLDEANGFISGRQPLAYLAKWEDRQVGLITCSAPFKYGS
jgi:hypothetical protein